MESNACASELPVSRQATILLFTVPRMPFLVFVLKLICPPVGTTGVVVIWSQGWVSFRAPPAEVGRSSVGTADCCGTLADPVRPEVPILNAPIAPIATSRFLTIAMVKSSSIDSHYCTMGGKLVSASVIADTYLYSSSGWIMKGIFLLNSQLVNALTYLWTTVFVISGNFG